LSPDGSDTSVIKVCDHPARRAHGRDSQESRDVRRRLESVELVGRHVRKHDEFRIQFASDSCGYRFVHFDHPEVGAHATREGRFIDDRRS
jgi:hypothetical protein